MALYDAFISYSHAKDKPIAAALQAAVQKLDKPWYRRRALWVFRVKLEKVGDARLAGGDQAGGASSPPLIRALPFGSATSARRGRAASRRCPDRRQRADAYEESLSVRRKLAAADAGDTGWQLDLSIGLEKVGDLYFVKGDRVRALAAYEEGLAIRRQLAAGDPANASWQRDVSMSLNKVGDVRRAAGDRAGALAVYEEALANDLAQACRHRSGQCRLAARCRRRPRAGRRPAARRRRPRRSARRLRGGPRHHAQACRRRSGQRVGAAQYRRGPDQDRRRAACRRRPRRCACRL